MTDTENKINGKPADEGMGLFDLVLAAILDIPKIMRTLSFAVWVFIILALFTLAGTILPQEHLTLDQDEFAHKYINIFSIDSEDGLTTTGEMIYYNIVKPLQLYRIFKTNLYFILLALLAISSTLCAWDRLKITRALLSKKNPKASESSINAMANSGNGSVEGNLEDVSNRARSWLKSQHFEVYDEKDESGTEWFYVRKNAIRHYASIAFHFAFVFILVGGILGDQRTYGYEGYVILGEGDFKPLATRAASEAQQNGVPYTPENDERLHLVDYQNIYRERDFPGLDPESGFPLEYNGMPSDYISHVQVVRHMHDGEDQILSEKMVEVNRPLRYEGVGYYQTSIRTIYHFSVTGPDGTQETFSTTTGEAFQVPLLNIQSGLAPMDTVGGIWETLDGTREDLPYRIRLNDLTAMFMDNTRPPVLLGYVSEDTPLVVDGYEIALDEAEEYTILQYVYDPGVPIVYFGGFTLILGLTIALYMPWRMGRLMLRREGQSGEWTAGGNWSEFQSDIGKAVEGS